MPLAAIPMAVALPLAVGGATLASGIIGARAATSAADTQAQGAIQASQIQAQSAQQSLDFQKGVYERNQSLLSPYINYGTDSMPFSRSTQDYASNALSTSKAATASLAQLYGLGGGGGGGGGGGSAGGGGSGMDMTGFFNNPAYQFPFQQGLLALTRNLNAQGLNNSGAQLREAQQFGQGLASQYLMSNYVNPLMQIAQNGPGMASSAVTAGLAPVELGQRAAGALVGNNVQQSANIGSTIGAVGQANASGVLGAANANAAGTVGAANALSGALSSGTNNMALFSLLAKNYQGGSNTTNPSSYQQPPGLPQAINQDGSNFLNGSVA